ncbi:nucleotidyltransferase family protein [Neorhizobium sp. NPDC001467]|uniref:nucleotidyltransferase family protein n=1 Tax=Neorhizobium sp. NPDC001467 TaxID=3390595 RepID=UPI003D07D82D
MDKDIVIAKLREHEAELRAAGAEHVSLFGSVARGDATADSDLDVLVKLSEPVILSGFGYFSALAILQDRITDITGYDKVDVVAEPITKDNVRRSIEKDCAIAF